MIKIQSFYRTARLTGVIVALLPFLFSCQPKVHVTMLETVDSDGNGASPPQSPLPNPPAESMVWTTQFIQSTVVDRPTGGKWVRSIPKQSYLTRQSAHILQSYSDVFTMGMNGGIRGNFTMQLVGSGTAFVFFYAAQGRDLQTTPIGGYALREGVNSADVAYLSATNVPVDFSNPFPRPGGLFLSSHKPGQILNFSWSINQGGPFLFLNVSPGGNAPQLQIPVTGKNLPIERIMMVITAYDFDKNTTLFVDDLKMEEY